MKILFLSSLCSAKKYETIYNKRTAPMLDTNQKFLLSIVSGIKAVTNDEITCISTVPVSYSCYPERVLHQETETVDGVNFYYAGGLNYPILRNLTVEWNTRRAVKQFIRENRCEKVVVICDILKTESAAVVNWLNKQGIPTFAIVTDIPSIAESMTGDRGIKSYLLKKYGERANRLMGRFQAYILLSEQMNEFCNPDFSKPYMIMECIIDPQLFDGVDAKKISKRPVVLYAGKYYKECGVVNLAKAAKYLQGDCDVVLYGGHGDCMDELEAERKATSNLYINGIAPLQEILAIEKGASILANPRPDTEEFTKFSFPSKTAEYMLAEVPVIMYELPSLPAEYKDKLYFFHSKEPQEMAEELKNIFKNYSEARRKANEAKTFIRDNKDSNHQAMRIVAFVKKIANISE